MTGKPVTLEVTVVPPDVKFAAIVEVKLAANEFRQIGLVDFSEYRVGANIFWQPVSGLDLGVEVIYAKIDPRGRLTAGNLAISSSDAIEGRLRVQRDF